MGGEQSSVRYILMWTGWLLRWGGFSCEICKWLAASSEDRCGTVQVLAVDGLAVSGGDWHGALPALVVRDVNGLRADVTGLRKDIQQMKLMHSGLEGGSSRSSRSDTQCIYVCLSSIGVMHQQGRATLSKLYYSEVPDSTILLRLGLGQTIFQSEDSEEWHT